MAAWSQADDLTAVLKDISGEVEVKQGNREWNPARVGMKLAAGDYLATGFDSRAVLLIPGGTEARLDEMTHVKIAALLSESGAVRTMLKLRTGGVDARVHRTPGVKTDFKVNTPTSTISVRGTEEKIFSMDGFGTEVEVVSGHVSVSSGSGQNITVSRGDRTKVQTSGSTPTSPADHRLDEAIVSLPDLGRTPDERQAYRSATVQQMINRFEEELVSSQAFQEMQNAGLRIDFEITE